MPSSSTSASNWDFTPVINLLRSPTFQSGEQPSTPRHHPHPVAPSPSQKTTENDVKNLTARSLKESDASSGSPKLGDFDALWEALSDTKPPTLPSIETRPEVPSAAPEPSTQPIVILKRPPIKDTKVEKPKTSPRISFRAPSKPASVLNAPLPFDSPLQNKAVPKVIRRHDRQTKAKFEPSSSESTAAGESDGYLSVFDRPISKARGIPSMIPTQVGISEPIPELLETPPSSFDEADEFLTPNAVKILPSGIIRVQPLTYSSPADQRVGLLTKLLKTFPDYAELVIQMGRPTALNNEDAASRPIHVFIDMSNIMIGFHDSMKVSRNIPVKTRIRGLPLSFQNFSLILERGRPAAKRVLVGSDRLAAINEGEQLGYEANILDRVHKVKHATPRQLKFRKNSPRTGTHDGGHSSETNDLPEERWVEQGVDEILHLKILESLLDTEQPATIVLATGDAAEAEFSGGFMKMAERALQRGWTVELVSFSQVMSYAYRKKEFRTRWGDQFQMIILDEYIEELLEI